MRELKMKSGIFALLLAMIITTNTKAQDKNIVELAVGTECLSTLVAAVKADDLVETLQSEGPFTVFAPTNEAFAALPEGVLDMLLKPENKDKLVAVLTYHVVPGKVMSKSIKDGMKAKSVEGSTITLKKGYGKVMVDNATVAMADVVATNGVVHVIDTVILPPSIVKALSKK